MPETPSWSEQRAAGIIAGLADLPGACLPILHALQDAFGFVPAETVPMIAQALNQSRAEIHGVVSFYHDFRTAPPGRHVLKLCRAEACRAMAAEDLAREVLERLRLDWGETSADGALTIEPVYCLGLCACAPAALFDGRPVGRLDGGVLADLVQEARA